MAQKPPQTLTIEECDTLLSHLQKEAPTLHGKRVAIRNTCICLVMLDAGLRVGEAIRIQRGALSWLGKPVNVITVHASIAKKGSARLLPVTLRLRALLELMQLNLWLPDDRHQEQTAFYNLKSRRALTKQTVGYIIRQAGRLSLYRDIHPHMLRHTFATNLMRTTNARVVQELLGHKRLSSTQIYCHPNQQDLRKAIDSLPAGK
ncbi:Tyrosine recombinase XerC [subsurface metagenome]